MRFAPSDDQTLYFDALEQIATDPAAEFRPAAGWQRLDWAAGLDEQIAANGYLDVAAEAEFGLPTAAAAIMRLARLPVTLEIAASAMLRPLLGTDLPRPLAVLEDAGGPTRFLPVARSLLRLTPDGIHLAALAQGAGTPVDSLFAYPMGQLAAEPDWQRLDLDPAVVLAHWRLALAAEIAGNLHGALDSVLDHVRVRKQFGQPLGAFQGVQHRLADASVRVEGLRWLVLRAAESLVPAEAALALGQAQSVATPICHDLHQFMGAMGLTLEHPLHRWTYRVRALRGSLGGSAANLALAARLRWGQK